MVSSKWFVDLRELDLAHFHVRFDCCGERFVCVFVCANLCVCVCVCVCVCARACPVMQ